MGRFGIRRLSNKTPNAWTKTRCLGPSGQSRTTPKSSPGGPREIRLLALNVCYTSIVMAAPFPQLNDRKRTVFWSSSDDRFRLEQLSRQLKISQGEVIRRAIAKEFDHLRGAGTDPRAKVSGGEK